MKLNDVLNQIVIVMKRMDILESEQFAIQMVMDVIVVEQESVVQIVMNVFHESFMRKTLQIHIINGVVDELFETMIPVVH